MALTPESLTEQQMQPLPTSSHSVAVVVPVEMEIGLGSRSVVGPNSAGSVNGDDLFGKRRWEGVPFRITAMRLPCRAVRM